MIKIKKNTLHVEMKEAEHSTTSGIIVDSHDDKFVSHGALVQDAYVKDSDKDEYIVIPKGTHIIYSKDKIIPISENEGVVEYRNVIGWEE